MTEKFNKNKIRADMKQACQINITYPKYRNTYTIVRNKKCDSIGLNVMTTGKETSKQTSEHPSMLRYLYVSCLCRIISLTAVLLAL